MYTLFDTHVNNIRNYISEKDLLESYIGKIKPICSPFRDDKSPTITFKETGDSVIWRDWKTGEKGDVFEFIAKLERVSRDDVGKVIFQKFKNGFQRIKVDSSFKPKPKEDRRYAVKVREFNNGDLHYWNLFGISQTVLNFFNVYAIQQVLVEDNNNKFYPRINDRAYCYGYLFTNWKIYSPKTPKDKWLFYGSINEIEGWKQLPESGDLLVITKSLKDIMVLYTLGIPAISFQGERNVPIQEIIDELKLRFKRIVLLYDNDETGKESSQIISDIYGLEQTFIPEEYGKDVSDVREIYGYEFTEQIINSII